jgi:divalent metal cation (Fe/Co/Zn/Cd) transporter
MTDWIRASNPTALITNEAEATAAARASALAIFLGVAWGLVSLAILMTSGSAAMDAALADAAADAPEMAGMGEMLTQMAMWTAGGMIVIQAVLGLVQWARPNIVIPIIFVILVAFGLISGLFGLAMQGQVDVPQAAQTPMWQIVVGIIVLVLQLIMHIAGIRGARQLDKLRFEAANR